MFRPLNLILKYTNSISAIIIIITDIYLNRVRRKISALVNECFLFFYFIHLPDLSQHRRTIKFDMPFFSGPFRTAKGFVRLLRIDMPFSDIFRLIDNIIISVLYIKDRQITLLYTTSPKVICKEMDVICSCRGFDSHSGEYLYEQQINVSELVVCPRVIYVCKMPL